MTDKKDTSKKQVPEKPVQEKPVREEHKDIIEKSDEVRTYGFKPTVDREDTVPPTEEGDGDD